MYPTKRPARGLPRSLGGQGAPRAAEEAGLHLRPEARGAGGGPRSPDGTGFWSVGILRWVGLYGLFVVFVV